MTARNGWDTIADLRDAPDRLRLLADWHDLKDSQSVVDPGLPEVQDNLRRYADAIQEFLDGTSGAHWKAYAYLGACVAVGFFAGVVTMMVLVR